MWVAELHVIAHLTVVQYSSSEFQKSEEKDSYVLVLKDGLLGVRKGAWTKGEDDLLKSAWTNMEKANGIKFLPKLNIASTTTTTSMDSKNNIDHQEENHSDPISPLEKETKCWESLLYDTLEANAGDTCSTGSGSDGEKNKMEKVLAEQLEPAAAGSNIGIGEAFVEDHKSLWRDLISMDIDLWDL
ncbi:hypothetical protein FNV43_RR10601 [Rhamnella rubrinervis]|uniref:Uncharacterized protein n=1 Tax=Rhamnella rubrinervis TaxID=2594499 RepID=A0A8K0H4N4_9ROSA|nr:hypothetical protein FNV43_RR10601 [Rhamnella rubrinervis]